MTMNRIGRYSRKLCFVIIKIVRYVVILSASMTFTSFIITIHFNKFIFTSLQHKKWKSRIYGLKDGFYFSKLYQ